MLILCLSTVLAMLLFEYHFFCNQSQKLLALQSQYNEYVIAVKKKLNKQDTLEEKDKKEKQSQVTTGAGFLSDNSFVLINREPQHLKKSTIDYLKDQNLNVLLQQINMGDWQDYTEQLLLNQQVNPVSISSGTVNNTSVQPRKQVTNKFFIWPIKKDNFWLSSFFAPRKEPDGSWRFHKGIDMAALKDTPVKAAANGSVVEARFAPGYGNTVVVAHNNNLKTRYAHLNRIKTKVGKRVSQGELIGTVGDTGFVRKEGKDASHLHFEILKHGKQVNPFPLLP